MSIYQLKSQFQDHLRPISDALVNAGFTANQVTISAVVLSAGTAYIVANIANPTNPTHSSTEPAPKSVSNPQHSNIKHFDAGHNSKTDDENTSSHNYVWIVLPVSLFLRMALNAIDGMMAKEHNQQTTLGAWLNEAGDIVSDTLLLSSLSPHLSASSSGASHLELSERSGLISQTTSRTKLKSHLLAVITLSQATEITAIISTLITGSRANQGPMGKSDRALALGVLGAINASGVLRQPLLKHARFIFLCNELLLIKTLYNRTRYIAQSLFTQLHPAPTSTATAKPISKPITYQTVDLTTQTTNAVASHHMQDNVQDNAMTDHAKASSQSTNSNSDSDLHETSSKTSADTSSAASSHAYDDSFSQTNPKQDWIEKQSCFNAYDGTALFYRYWLTQPLSDIQKRTKAASKDNAGTHGYKQVILLHRGHEHSGRLAECAEQFVQAGYQVFAWDARGNGRSGGIKDHADSVTELERDLDDFVQLVVSTTGIGLADTVLVASSIGAVLAAAWVHDYAPTLRGMILGTPALAIRLYIPLAIPALKAARKLGLMARVSSYVKAQVLTHDKQAQDIYNADPLISSSISSDLLIDTHATGQRLLDDAAAITIPTFILCAGKDYVVDKQAERDFYERLASPIKRWQLYPDSFHAIFHETNKHDVINDCIAFADELFAKPLDSVDLSCAHQDSPSKDKVDRLAIKPFNPRFALTRMAMQKFGHISDAISTGLTHGFDSGSSLDKVYNNEPNGKTALGTAIDKFYLNNVGWQGIRIRRQHILELADIAIHELSQHDLTLEKSALETHAPLNLLDIAAGNGFYVFDILQKHPSLTAELRDYDTHNIQVLKDKAGAHHLTNRTTVTQADAFDSQSYKNNHSSHNKSRSVSDAGFDIAIASGVFELFSDNTLIQTALDGLAETMADHSYLIYTNQPWHPEQEFIGKTLHNHQGQNWVMRCRSQAEMDQLVANAGFKKVAMRIDRFGIFTVSLAVKNLALKNNDSREKQVSNAASK